MVERHRQLMGVRLSQMKVRRNVERLRPRRIADVRRDQQVFCELSQAHCHRIILSRPVGSSQGVPAAGSVCDGTIGAMEFCRNPVGCWTLRAVWAEWSGYVNGEVVSRLLIL